MNVVRHYDECMQVVVLQGVLTFHDGLHDQAGDFGPSQVKRAGAGMVQEAVHGYKRLPRAETVCGEEAVRRQTAV